MHERLARESLLQSKWNIVSYALASVPCHNSSTPHPHPHSIYYPAYTVVFAIYDVDKTGQLTPAGIEEHLLPTEKALPRLLKDFFDKVRRRPVRRPFLPVFVTAHPTPHTPQLPSRRRWRPCRWSHLSKSARVIRGSRRSSSGHTPRSCERYSLGCFCNLCTGTTAPQSGIFSTPFSLSPVRPHRMNSTFTSPSRRVCKAITKLSPSSRAVSCCVARLGPACTARHPPPCFHVNACSSLSDMRHFHVS